jgi:hypothetical protein
MIDHLFQAIKCVNSHMVPTMRDDLKLQWWPNGVIKTMQKASSDIDDNIFTLTFYNDVNVFSEDSDF